jgi:hypothetical protein
MSRQIVEEVLGKRDAKELWGAGYRPALPITPQYFSLESVLPAILYMMRWGHRRGKGRFFDIYGDKESNTADDEVPTEGKVKSSEKATIAQVAKRLSQEKQWFDGFTGDVHQAILGDLLLCYCLENKNHRTGREEQVQRVFPTHYLSGLMTSRTDS